MFSIFPGKKTLFARRANLNRAIYPIKIANFQMMLPDQLGNEGGEAPAASNWWHVAATATTGAVGGAFGWLALTIELPISTTIIMRSIADIARSEGADLEDLQVQLECLQVLALGGNSNLDDSADIGYFVAREAMSRAVSEASSHLAKNGLRKGTSPAIVRLITLIAERYSINVTEKAATQLLPVIGALGGAVINTVFIDHFQNMARGHFIMRRLESRYGAKIVRQNYLELKLSMDGRQTSESSDRSLDER